MKLKLFFIFYIFFITQSFVNANANIVFIDTNFILNSSLVGKSINEQLKNIDLKNTKSFDKIETNLKLEESKIISQKNVLNESEFKEKINKLSIDIKKYNKVKKNKINLINKRMVESKRKLLIEINLIIGEYSKNKTISMVIQKKNIIIGKTELDITIPIFKILNNSIKTIKIK